MGSLPPKMLGKWDWLIDLPMPVGFGMGIVSTLFRPWKTHKSRLNSNVVYNSNNSVLLGHNNLIWGDCYGIITHCWYNEIIIGYPNSYINYGIINYTIFNVDKTNYGIFSLNMSTARVELQSCQAGGLGGSQLIALEDHSIYSVYIYICNIYNI